MEFETVTCQRNNIIINMTYAWFIYFKIVMLEKGLENLNQYLLKAQWTPIFETTLRFLIKEHSVHLNDSDLLGYM